MAKLTLMIQDETKEGQQLITGRFDIEDAPQPPAPGLPAMSTPAQMFMTCIQRLWDAGVINAMLKLAVPDLLYKNQRLQDSAAKREIGGVPLPVMEGTVNAEQPAEAPQSPVESVLQLEPPATGHTPSTLSDPVQLDDDVLKSAGAPGTGTSPA